MFSFLALSQLCIAATSIALVGAASIPREDVFAGASTRKNAQVLILGGGVTGIIAARTLEEQGITDYLIVEARPELGGRMMSHTFGRNKNTIEVRTYQYIPYLC